MCGLNEIAWSGCSVLLTGMKSLTCTLAVRVAH